jgi:hypothetical protein
MENEKTKPEKRGWVVTLVLLVIVVVAYLYLYTPRHNESNTSMAAGIHDLNTARPRPVSKMIGKEWYSVYGRSDHSIAKLIIPVEDNVHWIIMFNDDTNQIYHRKARNEPGGTLVNTNEPWSVKICLEPDAPVQMCEFSWDLIPR